MSHTRQFLTFVFAAIVHAAPVMAADQSITIHGDQGADPSAVATFVTKFEGELHTLDITVEDASVELDVITESPTNGLWQIENTRSNGAKFRLADASAHQNHASSFKFRQKSSAGGGGGGGSKTYEVISQQIQIFASYPGEPEKEAPRPTQQGDEYYGIVLPNQPEKPVRIRLVYNRSAYDGFDSSSIQLAIANGLKIVNRPADQGVAEIAAELQPGSEVTFDVVHDSVSVPVINEPLPITLTLADQFGAIHEDEVKLLPVDIIPDYNRDGKIDQTDRGKITTEKPWRFWVNKDDDAGETEGSDISGDWLNGLGSSRENWQDQIINGIRDLVDYFPLHLELKQILSAYPETEFQYYIKHKTQTRVSVDGFSADMPSFGLVWFPDVQIEADPLGPDGVGSYLKNIDCARAVANLASNAVTHQGLRIPAAMLDAAKEGKGIVLLEGRQPTTNPLILEIRKNDQSIVAEVEFAVSISHVSQMYRYKFVMPGANDLTSNDMPSAPSNWPDSERNNKHFVFVHGYNVNDTQSTGWGSEFFKRLFWSGSNARFTAFGWYGYQEQTPDLPVFGRITADYQANLDNAFGTAKSFKQLLDLIEGEKNVAGHSMGNILVGSAMHDWDARPKNYFMLNAAAAKECYDPAEADEPTQDAAMENLIWRGYPKILRASEWHRLLPPAAWPDLDGRGKLTWRGRLAKVIHNGGNTDVYNFYSSGEEVLNNPNLNTPETNNVITDMWTSANRAWAVQEKRKGHGITGYIHTSNYGGWRFNLMTAYDPVIHDTASGSIQMKTITQLPEPLNNAFLFHLASNPFFDSSGQIALYDQETGSNTLGSNHAYSHRNTIISEMIPCTSFAAGRNAIAALGDQNIDMDSEMKTDASRWPLSNEHDLIDNRPRPWLHSDVREKAFTHNWKVYEKFVNIGNLKSSN